MRSAAALVMAVLAVGLLSGCSGIRWRPDLGGAMDFAARNNMVVIVALWSPLNADCQRMEREVFAVDDVKATMDGTVPVRLDAYFNREFAKTLGLSAVPSFVAYAPDGRLLRMAQGYLNEGRFRGFVQAAKLSR